MAVAILVVLRLEHISQRDDVVRLATERLQVHDLAEGALRVGCILKGVKDFLESNNGLGLFVGRLEDDRIGALAQLLADVVLSQHVLRHTSGRPGSPNQFASQIRG